MGATHTGGAEPVRTGGLARDDSGPRPAPWGAEALAARAHLPDGDWSFPRPAFQILMAV